MVWATDLFGDANLDQGRCWVDVVDSIYRQGQLYSHCEKDMPNEVRITQNVPERYLRHPII